MALSQNPEKRAKQLANLKPFVPGANPDRNPGGRPAVISDFREWCKTFMATEGWNIVGEMAKDQKGVFRARAIELISAYAYGKPPQKLEHTGDEGGPIQFIEVARPGA